METLETRLTVFFEDPFWIGIYERNCAGKYEACKVTFGAEPKDYEICETLLENYYQLNFTPSVSGKTKSHAKKNPKRLQREIKKHVASPGVGTKAQQALKLQYEESKEKARLRRRLRKEEEKDRKFILRQQKRKEKLKGH